MIGALFLAPSLAAQGQESWRDDAASGPSFFKQDFSAYDNATVEQKLAATLQTGDVLLMEKYKGDWQWLGWAAKWLEERLSGTVFNHVGVVVRDRREDVAYLFEHTLAGPALRAVDERIERSGARLLLLRRLQPPASPSAETALRIERIVYAAVTGREAGPEVDAAYLLQDAREELRRRDELASPLRTASAFARRLATLARTAAAAALASQASPHESTVPHAVARLLALEASVAEHEAALAEARARLMGPSPASGSAERTVDYRVGLQKEMRLRTEQLDADRTELEALRSRLPALVARCARREGDAGPFPSTALTARVLQELGVLASRYGPHAVDSRDFLPSDFVVGGELPLQRGFTLGDEVAVKDRNVALAQARERARKPDIAVRLRRPDADK